MQILYLKEKYISMKNNLKTTKIKFHKEIRKLKF